jgi:lambda repressor-like predicted transcriptional regulator
MLNLYRLKIENGIYFSKMVMVLPQLKGILIQVRDGLTPQTIWTCNYHNQDAKKKLKRIKRR